MPSDDTRRGLIRAMPGVFVLIWSTGFVVARYGMPHAPPLTFLCLRYALSVLCFAVWIRLAQRGRAHGGQAQDHGADGGHSLPAL